MSQRFLLRDRRNVPILAVLLLTACAAGGAITQVALEAGRKMLSSTAEKNFGGEYGSAFDKMLDVLAFNQVAAATGAPTAPEGSAEPAATAGPAPAAPQVPLQLDVSVVRHVVVDGRPLAIPVQDGEELRDGVGRDERGDDLKVQFRVNTECYVYAVWVDATAWTTPLFPRSVAHAYENPARPNVTYSIPRGDDWFFLDDYRGVENVYFLASREPQPQLDELLDTFLGMERAFRAELEEPAAVTEPEEITRGMERAFRAELEEPAAVTEPEEITRGLGGVRPGQASLVQTDDGASHSVDTTSFVSQLAAGDLVVTRWFRHE